MRLIQVIQADITKFPTDVIVNAANTSLLGGGGVDGAIHRAAGKDLVFACRMLGGAKVGQAKMTDAFNITSAKKIIHAVGPVYKNNDPAESAIHLASCYRNSLELAREFTSIAFPAISTGIYGYPLKEASQIAVDTIYNWWDTNPKTTLDVVTLLAHTPFEFEVLTATVSTSMEKRFVDFDPVIDLP